MLAIKYAREQKIPFLGICLGFQLAVIEWARNVLNIPGVYHPFLILVSPSFPHHATRFSPSSYFINLRLEQLTN